MNQKIDPSKHLVIISQHELGLKPSVIAEQYLVTEDQIRRILKKHNRYKKRNSRQYFYNINYFSTIDTENKAYFLGLLYADGCNNHGGFAISLAEPDEYLLSYFMKEIEYDGKLKLVKKRKLFHKQKYVLAVHSKQISEDLTKLGCSPKKSLTLKFPSIEQVPEHLMCHFLRGVFDGDGCVRYCGKENKLHVSITSSSYFCEGLNNFLKKTFNFMGMLHNYSHSDAIDIKMSTRTAIIFLDFIYQNASIKMNRKYDKFIQFLSHYHPTNVGGTKITVEEVVKIRDKWLNLV